MKKILALALCVMLLAGLIPSAYADGIDLSPAYKQLESLYAAYGRLAGATLYVSSYEGFQNLGVEHPEQYLNVNDFVNGAPYSYEGLYENVGSQLAACYNEAASVVIANAAAEYTRVCNEVAANITTAANNMVAGMMAGLPWA